MIKKIKEGTAKFQQVGCNQSTLLFEYSGTKPTRQKIIRLSLVCTQTFFPFFFMDNYECMKTTTSA